MKHQRHFDPSDVALREVAQISALISDLLAAASYWIARSSPKKSEPGCPTL
jgi:hypothetical protein